MAHGKIHGDTYIKKEDEKQKLRMGGGSWSINLGEIPPFVKMIIYITEKCRYRIDIEDAFANGFVREFTTKGEVEKKLIVPIKHWELHDNNNSSWSINDRDFSKNPTIQQVKEKV